MRDMGSPGPGASAATFACPAVLLPLCPVLPCASLVGWSRPQPGSLLGASPVLDGELEARAAEKHRAEACAGELGRSEGSLPLASEVTPASLAPGPQALRAGKSPDCPGYPQGFLEKA